MSLVTVEITWRRAPARTRHQLDRDRSSRVPRRALHSREPTDDPAPCDDRGSVAVETAVVAPALVVLLLLVVFAGRVAQAAGDVRRAAAEGARAASLAQYPEEATAAAVDVVAANLATSDVGCADLETTVDTTAFAPGGAVTVTVRCVASMTDVALLGVPGERVFSAQSVEVIDRYRGSGRQFTNSEASGGGN